MSFIAVLGRQPKLSLVELERLFGAAAVTPVSDTAACVETETLDVTRLGGSLKAGRIVHELSSVAWPEASKEIVQFYERKWHAFPSKLTIGISVYGFPSLAGRDVQKTGLALKQRLKRGDVSVRLVPNDQPILSTATSHHNKLGLAPNKVELLIVGTQHGVIVAESTGAQNITALAMRDQARPKTDAFVGMLPPKLALMMINLALGPEVNDSQLRVLDPFCGTGVVLQEATLLGHETYGTDLSEKMVDYSTANLDWLRKKYHLTAKVSVYHGDAIETTWQGPIDAVVSETYLGQPFSAPPAEDKLRKVQRICEEIITKFLQNLAPQVRPGTPLCLAIPAWRDHAGRVSHLPLTHNVEKFGYERIPLRHADPSELLYFREDQIVARELLLLRRR